MQIAGLRVALELLYKTGNSFSKNKRLRFAHEFKAVLKSKAYASGCLLLCAKNNSAKIDRLGIVISKRIINSAVKRNKIKRQLREVFRVCRNPGDQTYDFVARLRNSEGTKSIKPAMIKLLQRAWMAEYDPAITSDN